MRKAVFREAEDVHSNHTVSGAKLRFCNKANLILNPSFLVYIEELIPLYPKE